MTDEITANEPLDSDADIGASHPSTALLVAAGGCLGTALRYLLSEAVPDAAGIPVGVLVVNVTGAAALGWLIEMLARRGPDVGRRRLLRLGLGSGVLGGYTTYSALATDTALLVTGGRPASGIGYAAVTVVVGAAATWAGIMLGRAHRGRP